MSRVMVFGTFDMLHLGHRYFLQKASEYGDELIAVVASDNFVLQYKNKCPTFNQQERLNQLLESGLTDYAIFADASSGSFEVLEHWQPEIIILGHDQLELYHALQQWAKYSNRSLKMVFLTPHKRRLFSSTKLQNKKSYIYLLLSLGMVAWASGWIAGRVLAQTTIATSMLILLRSFLTCSAFALLPLLQGKRPSLDKPSLAWVAAAAVLMLCYTFLYFRGLERVSSGEAGMLVSALNTIFISLLVSRARPSYFTIAKQVGLACGIIGVAIIAKVWQFDWQQSQGIWLLMLASFCWALLSICCQQAQRTTTLSDYLFFTYFITMILAVPFAWPYWQQLLHLQLKEVLAILWLSLVSTCLGTGVYFYAIKVIGADRAGSFTLLVPPLAVLEGFLILGERPSWLVLPAGMLILIGLFLLQQRKNKRVLTK